MGGFRFAVNCVVLRAPRGYKTTLGASTRRGEITLPPRQIGTLTINCRRGHAPIGFGGELPGVAGAPARAADLGRIGALDVRGAVPSRGRWRFTLRNNGGSPLRARMAARCVARRSTATPRRRRARGGAVASRRRRKRRHRNVVRRVADQVTLQPGNNDNLRAACPDEHAGVRTAHLFGDTDGNAFVYTSWAEPSGSGTWNIVADRTQQAALVLLCLDQRPRWARSR